MAYLLADLARMAGKRGSFALRPIEVTETLQRELYAITAKPVRGWQSFVRGELKDAYGAVVAALTRDDESDDLAAALAQAERDRANLSIEIVADVLEWMTRLQSWHRARWRQIVRAGSGVDIFPFIDELSSLPEIRAFEQRITSLIRNIDDDLRKDIAEVVWRGVTNQTPRRQVGKELEDRLGIARRRANRIAIDQSQKMVAELTRIRQNEAGIDQFKWRHSGKKNYRPEHKARNGKVYDWDSNVAKTDAPGFAPYCACQAQAWLEVLDE